MTNLITPLKSVLSNVVLFAIAVFMTVLGFAFVGTLALFGLMAVGVAMIAAPFIARSNAQSIDAEAAS